MKKYLLFFTIISLILSATSVFAGVTGKLAGTVTDANTKETLIGANVVILAKWVNGEEQPLNFVYGASTDLNGEYFILNILPGVYSVKVSYVGYQAEKVTKVVIDVDRTTVIDFEIKEQQIQTDEVTVVAYSPRKVEPDVIATKQVYDMADVQSIAYYSYLSGDNQYAKNANDLLKIWFINPKTKMNPNLKYSQLIRNRDRKRGVGIIDGRRLAVLTEGISLLNEMGKLDTSVFTGIKNWYSDYLEWLTQSYYGIDEKNRGNNHGTWWSFQVAIISSFVQNNAEIEMLNTHTKHFLLDNQIDEDGHQPMEEARTKSLSYCSFNLTAHSLLSTVLAKHNIDNWNYVNKNETTIIGAMDYLIPFIEHPNNWSHKQISTFNNSDALFLGLAGLQLNNREYLRLYNKLSKNYLGRINKPTYDPIQIIINVVVKTKLEENEK